MIITQLHFWATEVGVEVVGVSGGPGRGDHREGRDDNRGNGAGEVGTVEIVVVRVEAVEER